MKKRISLAVVVSMLLSYILVPSALAVSINENVDVDSQVSNGIVQSLADIELQKDMLSLDDVPFEELNVGAKIPLYEYLPTGFEELDISMYPLECAGSIVALAIDNGANKYQITTSLVDEISSVVKSNEKFALVYDSTTCYVLVDGELSPIHNDCIPVNTRSNISSDACDLDTSSLVVQKSEGTKSLNYTSTQNSRNALRSQTYYSCNISHVTQTPYENLCWAASVACIGNYMRNKSYNAVNVAKYVYGTSNFDQQADPAQVTSALYDIYNVSYYSFTTAPSDNTILSRIQNGRPLYGRFSHMGGSHAMVIYGINVVSGYITIMDPNNDCSTVYSNNSQYTYVSPSNGMSMTLYAHIS